MSNLPPTDRFFSKVNKTDGCWLWNSTPSTKGYGMYWVDGKYALAHRYSYQKFVGDIKDGYQIDHLCRVRKCVNPEHLQQVTQKENILRGTGVTSVNHKKTHCMNGHEFSKENTYITKKNSRRCRICLREKSKRFRKTPAGKRNEERQRNSDKRKIYLKKYREGMKELRRKYGIEGLNIPVKV